MAARPRKTELLLSLILLGASAAFAAAPPGPEELERKQQELGELRNRVQALRAGLEQVRGQRAELTQVLATSERRIGNLVRELRVLDRQLGETQAKLERLERRRLEKQAHLDEHRDALKSQLRTAYAMGRQERLKILLNQQDPAMVSRMMVYYDYLNRSRIAKMELIRRDISAVRRLEVEIATESQQLEALHAQQDTERLSLEQEQLERERLLAALDAEISSKGQRLADLQLDEERLQQFLRDLQRMLQEMSLESLKLADFAERKGKLPWPARGRLAVGFGDRRKRGNRRWDGVVIDAEEGKDVRAVHHGRVAFADWLRGFGLLLIVDHGDGFLSLYGHNQSLFKETGEWVEPGELIGLAGRSSGRTNPGVYFAIRKQTKPLNPRNWCKPAQGNRVG